MKTGLVSVTFRKLQPEEIVELVKKAGLDGIEWGGDIHVPHGNTDRAAEVAKLTRDSGLEVAAYGSYYRAGCINEKTGSFERTLETAAVLGAPTIRIWAGDKASAVADEDWWKKVSDDARIAAEMAEKYNITVSFEYHANTLTDTYQSAGRLLEKVAHKNIRSYWQPALGISFDDRLKGLQTVSPWLTNIHAYYWVNSEKRPLAEGVSEWENYIKEAESISGQRYVMLEFVRDDSTEQFMEDAAVLNKLVKKQGI